MDIRNQLAEDIDAMKLKVQTLEGKEKQELQMVLDSLEILLEEMLDGT